MSDRRRFGWKSGSLISTPLTDFWRAGTLDGPWDPAIPNLPLASAAAAGGVNTSASAHGGLTAVAAAVKALTTPASARLGSAAVVFGAKAVTQPAAALAGARAAGTAAKALAFAAQAGLGAHAADVAAKAVTHAASANAGAGGAAVGVRVATQHGHARGGGGASQAGGRVGDLHWTSVVLLLDMETGADGSAEFLDRSLAARTVSAFGNAQVDTTAAKYGTRAALFDGTGDYVQAADSPDIALGTGDFTVELWANVAAVASDQAIIALRLTADADTLYLYRRSSADPTNPNKIGLSDSTLTRAFSNAAIPSSTWVHLAWVRQSGVHRLFVDGALQAATWSSGGSPAGAYDPTAVRIGLHPLGVQPLTGSVDEVRVTAGVARYTGTFTAPTEAFPAWAAGPSKSVAVPASARAGVAAAASAAKAAQSVADALAGGGALAQSSATGAVTTSAAGRAGGGSAAAAAKALTIGDSAARSAARAESVTAKSATAPTAATAAPLGDATATPGTPIATSANGTAGLRGEAVATPGPAAPAAGSPGGGVLRPRRQTATPATPVRHVVTSAAAGARARGQAASRRAATTGVHAAGRSGGATHGARTGWAQADAMLLAAQQLAEYRFIVSRRPS